MFAEVQINELKPRMICVADGALVNGAPVAYTASSAGRKLAKATSDTPYVVTNAKNFDGINAIMEQTDAEHEEIANGALCIRVPLELGDLFATTEVTAGSAAVGAKFGVASSGKYAADANGKFVFHGAYENPWGLNMYTLEYVG